MAKPGLGCTLTALEKRIQKVGNKFLNDPLVKEEFSSATPLLEHIFYQVFDLPIQQMGGVKFDQGRVKTFQRRVNKVRKAIAKGQLTSKFGGLFYTPDTIAESNPELAKLGEEFHRVNLNSTGRNFRNASMHKNIIDSLKKEILVRKAMDNGASYKQAQKGADDFDNQMHNLVVELHNSEPGRIRDDVVNRLITLKKQEDTFYKTGEGKIFNDFRLLVEKSIPALEKTLYDEWRVKWHALKERGGSRIELEKLRKDKLLPQLRRIVDSKPMQNAVAEYLEFMEIQYKDLQKGMDAYVETIKLGMHGKYDTTEIDNIATLIKEKIMPDKKTGFYPHYRRIMGVDFLDNLMPHMQNVANNVQESLRDNGSGLNKAIESLKTYLQGHTKERATIKLEDASLTEEYSRNFFVNIKRYADEISRFNLVAHTDMYTKQSLINAKQMFRNGESLGKYGIQTVEQMLDLNAAMKGNTGFKNETLDSTLQTLLGLEFVSKLGLNNRGALRNSTQGLLNLVEFGPVIVFKSRDFYKRHRTLESEVDSMLEKAGLLFSEYAPELLESGRIRQTFSQKVKVGENSELELLQPSKMTKISRFVGAVGSKTGIFMRKAENFNRKATFRIAFYKMYEALHNSTQYTEALRALGGKFAEDAAIEREVISRARNYAIRKTSLLHFDYAEAAKVGALRTPLGKILGQFQHYGFKFFDYNRKLASEAKDDVWAGQLLGDNAQKAYRMGLVYFMAPAIASAVTGINWGNLVEHNTADKLNQLWTLFTGSEEEVDKAFYGKGPITGLLGAPLISDALALGSLHEWWELDDESKLVLLTGYEKHAIKSNDRKMYETLRILNTSIGRWAYSTVPQIMQGKLGYALQSEAGLYKTKESKAFKKQAIETATELTPELMEALAYIKQHQERAKKSGRYGI